jgi:hypothetical protein
VAEALQSRASGGQAEALQSVVEPNLHGVCSVRPDHGGNEPRMQVNVTFDHPHASDVTLTCLGQVNVTLLVATGSNVTLTFR